MSEWLADCGALLSADGSMWLAVLVAGVLGSLSHCSVMCSPAVMAQMLSLHSRRKTPLLVWFYHAGRITAYVMMGVAAALAAAFMFGAALERLASVFMLLAGISFLVSAAVPQKTHCGGCSSERGLARFIALLPSEPIRQYLRGFMMGFVPCGLVLSVLLMAGATGSSVQAAGIMLIFGLSTLPLLQAAGMAALSMGRRHPAFAFKAMRGGMALNGAILCVIGINGVHWH